jgi:hypothetical protein
MDPEEKKMAWVESNLAFKNLDLHTHFHVANLVSFSFFQVWIG